ncbi:hypothetical protein NIES2119_01930 [[Phormidium ambiguum] IAM M-71]|uniref:DUF4177 domain-containing protein n=1 Tax=[Phormidium ambiguum] IAM M-71 TaxID=454136 RepID=A0A1U7ISI3_9CYAN|nr:hypothetical protein [Phormidium ambiguum]OKH40406.1 hypothetical protein NIES2119_01930 [Phormidium ambiguum IAM M-71]
MNNTNLMKSWEYCIIKYRLLGLGNTQEIEQLYLDAQELKEWNRKPLRIFLNQLGKDGWEMVGVSSNPDSTWTFIYFKRPL